SCKSVIMCPNCSTSLTYHSANRRLMCHHCGHSQPYTDVCPTCGERAMQYSGYGTQRIEDELTALFPKARILRMDADTTMAKYAYQEKLSAFADGEYDIMLGTQMVAKGLDFPRVTLVGIVSIDQQLFNDDFRAGETAFDLLTQVIGRSGRAENAGKAYIQTMLPDNEIIALSAKQDFEQFYKTESVIRKSLLYPPYCEMCVLTFISDSLNRSMSGAGDFRQMLVDAVGERYRDVTLELLEPVRPRLGKINNKYRIELTIKCRNNKRFRELIAETLTTFMKSSREVNVSVSVDINPLN
ncbi:MAG: primosomal protein N', partial [Clostridia bacterium]|nr:primosomal protein N' [Clostridia bacterium]